jgi:hypothetical protein
MRHRNYVYLLVLVVLAVTLVGGLLNDTTARGRVLDESTGDPITQALVTYGIRSVYTDTGGAFALEHLPRGARFTVQLRGYEPASAEAERTEIKLHPFSMSLTVTEKDSGDPAKPVAKPEIRQGDARLGGPGTDTGSVVAAPYPQIGSQLLVCAPGFDTTTIAARGGAASPLPVALPKGTAGCPPLPTPSSTPTPSGTPLPTGTPLQTASPTPPAPSKSP